MFRRAEIFFSIGGQYYQSQPLKFNYQQDSYFENARKVVIRLANQIGRFVRIDLYFESRWIMISEVEFESGKCLSVVVVKTFSPKVRDQRRWSLGRVSA